MNPINLESGHQTASKLAKLLQSESLKIVLAESCTCGMAAALLGSVPGISNYLCGSAVTYRIKTKATWLQLSEEQIEQYSAESAETTRDMAIAVLDKTPEANWSAAITGDLGPGAGDREGTIFVCVAQGNSGDQKTILESTFQLNTADRVSKQIEAARLLLEQLFNAIQSARE